MTNPHDKALQAAANELLAHGEFGTFEEANRRNAVSAAGAAISAYLSSIDGVVCAREPVGYAYRDKRWDSDHWHLCGSDSKPRAFEGRTILSAHLPIEAGNGGDGWLDIASAPKDSPIIAISWQDGYGSFESKWSKPEVYEWDEMHSYWANKQRGTCIWPKYQDRYRCKSLGRAPSPPSPSNEGEKP